MGVVFVQVKWQWIGLWMDFGLAVGERELREEVSVEWMGSK